MATAASRGWGTGWPDCQRSKMVTVHAGGIRLLVRKEVAPIFKGFCDELVQRGYPLGGVADDWGFACRQIRGSSQPSNHSWGLAIDLNATTNPMGSRLVTDFPAWAVKLGEDKYGLHWGGRYRSRPDAMHWEWLGTPAEAKWLIASLAALPAEQQPPEPPRQEDDMPYNVRLVSDATIDGHDYRAGDIYTVIGQVRRHVLPDALDEATADWGPSRDVTSVGFEQIVRSTATDIIGLRDLPPQRREQVQRIEDQTSEIVSRLGT